MIFTWTELFILLIVLAIFIVYPIWEIYHSQKFTMANKIQWSLFLIIFPIVGFILYITMGRNKI
ncbi:PLDc N-terminal domain-containing protein [Sphingobacterium sp. JB170]|uniref:PLDc N-terminal domain-containing protein n=1 Tax=Sphingobacterium sp. JB170 TaxID=1434842 RepID=UPI000B35ED57